MTSLALLFTLACIGISETVYLVRKRIASERPICPIGEGCEIVLTSKWNKIIFIPNDLLGLMAYIVIATICAFLVVGLPPVAFWNILLVILVGIALLMSAFFTYLQWCVIKAWCFWCLMSTGTIVLMSLIIFVNMIK